MIDYETERYVDRMIHQAKKELRESILNDIDEIFVKAAYRVNEQTETKDILKALKYEVENKLRMGI